MKYVKLVWFVINVVLLFFYTGCGVRIYAAEAAGPSNDASRLEVGARDVVMDVMPRRVDAGVVVDVSIDAPTRVPDVFVTSNDVASARDVAIDVSRTIVVDAGALRFIGTVLSPTTCHGRTLHLPDAMTEPGWQAFHLCYVTLDSRDRLDGGALNPRPASVEFGVGADLSSQLVPVVTAMAPTAADPWTASVAVALPSTVQVPRFNVRHQLPPPRADVLWALTTNGGNNLIVRGVLRVWQVDANGAQTEVPLQTLFSVCGGGIPSGNLPGASYVPQSLCPPAIAACPVGPYHCRR